MTTTRKPPSLSDLAALARYSERERERSATAGEFLSLCRFLMLHRGDAFNAADAAKGAMLPPRVVETIEKTAVAAAGGTTWGGELVEFRQLAGAFTDTLRTASAFYRLRADMMDLPFEVRFGAILTGAAVGTVDRGAAIPVTKLNLGSQVLEREKAAAIVVLSMELLRQNTSAESIIGNSLRGGLAGAVDARFLSIITAGVTPVASTGAALSDLAVLLNTVDPTEQSRLYWLASPAVAIRLATTGTETVGSPATPAGAPVFPDVSPVGGGMLLGIPLLVSSAVPADRLLLLDATAIGAAADPIELDASQNASVEMDSAPASRVTGTGSPDAPVAANVVSLWQSNAAGLRALAYFGAAVMRPGAVAVVSNVVNW